MTIYLTVLFGLLGASIGSFLNVVVDRLPANQSLNYPPSHCDACRRRLTFWDLVPVFSYIFLRGRCRTCGALIPVRVLLVELGCGLYTAWLFWSRGMTLEFGVIALYSYIFLVVALIDLKHQLILNKVILPAVIAGLVIAPFFIKGGNFQGMVNFLDARVGLLNAVIGAGVGFLCILIPFLVTLGRGMGLGDVKMALFMGLATGFGQILVAVLGGIVLGGVAAIFLLVFRLKKRKEAIPFGPFLAIASVVTLLWGTPILQWYMGLFGG